MRLYCKVGLMQEHKVEVEVKVARRRCRHSRFYCRQCQTSEK